jgi:ADP-heptose:LPS heptosyltransferase
MTENLFINTSSMGNEFHHMPAVTDARKHFPRAWITWIVDEMYTPLVKLYPPIDKIISTAANRWRKQFYKPFMWREFIATLRDHVLILGVAQLIVGARIVTGVDCRFLHNAAILGTPIMAVFTVNKHSR